MIKHICKIEKRLYINNKKKQNEPFFNPFIYTITNIICGWI